MHGRWAALAVTAALATGGCIRAPFRVGSLDRHAPAFSAASAHSDHELIECVQRQWEDRGAQVATVARPGGVRLTARSATYSSLLIATADIDAYPPRRELTVRTARRSRGYARAAQACL